jgi:hypothetical protein
MGIALLFFIFSYTALRETQIRKLNSNLSRLTCAPHTRTSLFSDCIENLAICNTTLYHVTTALIVNLALNQWLRHYLDMNKTTKFALSSCPWGIIEIYVLLLHFRVFYFPLLRAKFPILAFPHYEFRVLLFLTFLQLYVGNTSPRSGCRSVGIVRSRTQTMELVKKNMFKTNWRVGEISFYFDVIAL